MTLDHEEEGQEGRPQLKFKVIDGGNNDGANWLADLPESTVFIFRPRKRVDLREIAVNIFIVKHKYRSCTLLQDTVSGTLLPVDNIEFSNIMKLCEILDVRIEGESDAEQCDRSNREQCLEGHEEPPGRCEGDEPPQ